MYDAHDDFASEPIRGLPEVPPRGEVILWQGAPNWFALARDALNVGWVAAYFVGFAAWRSIAAWADLPLGEALLAGTPLLAMGALSCAILFVIAYVTAKSTVYTITSRRVAMRVGAALTVTLNLPYRWIESVDLDLRKGGTGTLALSLKGESQIGFLTAWPHTRPWRMKKTEPALRCIPKAAEVAKLLADAAEARMSEPVLARSPMQPAMAAE